MLPSKSSASRFLLPPVANAWKLLTAGSSARINFNHKSQKINCNYLQFEIYIQCVVTTNIYKIIKTVNVIFNNFSISSNDLYKLYVPQANSTPLFNDKTFRSFLRYLLKFSLKSIFMHIIHLL